MRTTICLAVLAVALAGCAGAVSQQALSDGTHEISYQYAPGFDTGADGMAEMTYLAEDLCPQGWEKLSEKHIGKSTEDRSLVWHIACL